MEDAKYDVEAFHQTVVVKDLTGNYNDAVKDFASVGEDIAKAGIPTEGLQYVHLLYDDPHKTAEGKRRSKIGFMSRGKTSVEVPESMKSNYKTMDLEGKFVKATVPVSTAHPLDLAKVQAHIWKEHLPQNSMHAEVGKYCVQIYDKLPPDHTTVNLVCVPIE